MASKKVCTIILNWNNWRHTLECLDSLMGAIPCPDVVIVCDNGSTDTSVEKILQWAISKGEKPLHITGDKNIFFRSTEKSASLVLITNSSNLGYSGGNNCGIRYALAQHQFDFVWVLNNDTIVAEDSLKKLLSCAGNQKLEFLEVQSYTLPTLKKYSVQVGADTAQLHPFFIQSWVENH